MSFDLQTSLERIRHWLPQQGPIKDFIHHNTLHAFQDRPFHEGILEAAQLYGARPYMDLSWYREALGRGAISSESLDRVLSRYFESATERTAMRSYLLDGAAPFIAPFPGIARSGCVADWKQRGVDIEASVHPLLFRLIAGYLDQGIASWRMPHASETFWNAVGKLVEESWAPYGSLSNTHCQALLSEPAERAIMKCLEALVGTPAHYERYLLEMLLSHPGWSGMVASIERKPSGLLIPRQMRLVDFAAVELVMQVGAAIKTLGKDFKPLVPKTRHEAISRQQAASLHYPQLLMHEALEETLYCDVFAGLEAHAECVVSRPLATTQVFFCIDDRECSLRRHIEEVEPTVETFGTAGFFGMDFYFRGLEEIHPTQMCPVVITPRHLVVETSSEPRSSRRMKAPTLIGSRNSLFRGWLATQTLGIWATVRLFLQVFRPGTTALFSEPALPPKTRLMLVRNGEDKDPEGRYLGYSIEELATRVRHVLSSSGLIRGFSKLVVIMGHGSTSANNPHYAAYDCGACSGRRAAPNARAFAWAANDPAVRRQLAAMDFEIPSDCHFIGGLHDTSKDTIEFFDEHDVPKTHAPQLQDFRIKVKEALKRNAKERCRRFELVPMGIPEQTALKHVHDRALSIFEPRPELNHATNALAIVGRRDSTRGLFLDRRCFLNSYNPKQDPNGKILSGILGAVIPVCGGINLEYFFSRVDNTTYGAGTKLPHNVMALVGVANGVGGDLRNGLPSQMIEVHDPVRLLVVVEQTCEIALAAVKMNPSTYEWVKNDWVRYACLCPETKRTYLLLNDAFVPAVECLKSPPKYPTSLSVVEGHRDSLPVAEIEGVGTRP